MRFFLLLSFLFFSWSASAQQWMLNKDEAFAKASEEQRHVLLVFSGSDWCGPCIKLEREVWESEEFKSYAQDNLILLKADFPRKKANQLSDAQMQHNAALADRYNDKGYFPFVLLLDEKGEVIKVFGAKRMSPEAYVEQLAKY